MTEGTYDKHLAAGIARHSRRVWLGVFGSALLLLVLLQPSSALATGRSRPGWVGSWSASPMPADAVPDLVPPETERRTVRQIVHLSVGGERVRIRLSNAFGEAPLLIGSAHLALQRAGANIVAGSDRALTFSGQASVTIPPGAEVLSDALRFEVSPLANLAVSLYLPRAAELTWHPFANQDAYLSPKGSGRGASGDFTDEAVFPVDDTVSSWLWLSGVDVTAEPRLGTLIALGDSLTDGAGSTPGANRRWPDALSALLNRDGHGPQLAVLNQGAIGNRLLHDVVGPNASARFDRDVLARPGVTRVLVLLGINDIGSPTSFGPAQEAVSAEDIERGLRQLVERAHAQRLLVYGGTLPPFEGTLGFPGNFFTPEGRRSGSPSTLGSATASSSMQWSISMLSSAIPPIQHGYCPRSTVGTTSTRMTGAMPRWPPPSRPRSFPDSPGGRGIVQAILDTTPHARQDPAACATNRPRVPLLVRL